MAPLSNVAEFRLDFTTDTKDLYSHLLYGTDRPGGPRTSSAEKLRAQADELDRRARRAKKVARRQAKATAKVADAKAVALEALVEVATRNASPHARVEAARAIKELY
jgi:hypothetical protein